MLIFDRKLPHFSKLQNRNVLTIVNTVVISSILIVGIFKLTKEATDYRLVLKTKVDQNLLYLNLFVWFKLTIKIKLVIIVQNVKMHHFFKPTKRLRILQVQMYVTHWYIDIMYANNNNHLQAPWMSRSAQSRLHHIRLSYFKACLCTISSV